MMKVAREEVFEFRGEVNFHGTVGLGRSKGENVPFGGVGR